MSALPETVGVSLVLLMLALMAIIGEWLDTNGR